MADPIAVATLDDLKSRLDWELDDTEARVAQAALDDLSVEARFIGLPSWTSPNTTPQIVRVLVLRAAARYMKNADGYIQSRAGDETVMWSDLKEIMGTATFTTEEANKLSSQGMPSGFGVAGTYAWTDRPATGHVVYVPVNYGGAWWPFGVVNEEGKLL